MNRIGAISLLGFLFFFHTWFSRLGWVNPRSYMLHPRLDRQLTKSDQKDLTPTERLIRYVRCLFSGQVGWFGQSGRVSGQLCWETL